MQEVSVICELKSPTVATAHTIDSLILQQPLRINIHLDATAATCTPKDNQGICLENESNFQGVRVWNIHIS